MYWLRFAFLLICFLFTFTTASAQIVINEIHADPAAGLAGDANGDSVRSATEDEFVELMNTTVNDIDISGWTLSDAVRVRHTFPAGSILSPDCGIVIFGGGSPTGSFGNIIVQTAGGLSLNNAGDQVILRNNTNTIDSVAYGSEGGDDQSLTRDPDITGAFVQHSLAKGSLGALFSPGTLSCGDNFSGCTAGTQPGSIQIVKSVHQAVDIRFPFDGDLGAFSVSVYDTTTFSDLSPNSYRIFETLNAHWQLDSISVAGGGGMNIGNGYQVDLQAGQNVILTFHNLKRLHTTSVLINEIDSDTPGSDDEEFIELFDGGIGNTPLDSLVLILFDGDENRSYAAFDLDGYVTDANGFFVMGNTPKRNMYIPPNTLQNGADAVALFFGDAADFPNGTPVTALNLVDAVVYDTNDDDAIGLLALLNIGQPQLNEDETGAKEFVSLQRIPNGSGGARNTSAFTARLPTPNIVNDVQITQADLAIQVSVSNNPVQAGSPLTYTLVVSNNGPATAENVVVSDSLPSGVQFVSATTTQGSTTIINDAVKADVGSMMSNDIVTVVISVITNVLPTTHINYAYITSTTDDPHPMNDRIFNSTIALPKELVELKINEIDSDTPGLDDHEFIELFDGGAGNTPLDHTIVTLFNGSDDLSYAVFDLDGYATDANGFFVLGNAAVTGVDLTFPDNTLQNGPDAVALYYKYNYLTGRPIDTSDLIDAIVYNTDGEEDSGLHGLLNIGQPQVNEDNTGAKELVSLQRIPNGSGGARNTSTYVAIEPTPDRTNDLTPNIGLWPMALDFGDVFVGSKFDTLLTVFNNGKAPLQIDSTKLVGPDSTQWVVTTGAGGFTIAPMDSHKVRVSFGPKSNGGKTAALHIFSNDPDEKLVSVPLTGNGIAPHIHLSAASLDFGDVKVGSEYDIDLYVKNVGSAPLQLDSTKLVGPDSTQWVITEGAGSFTIAPMDSHKVRVCFDPKSSGKKTAALHIFSNDPVDSLLIVPLSGNGVAPDIQSSVAGLDFGETLIMSEYDIDFLLSNQGNATLTVDSVTVVGPDSSEWFVTQGKGPFDLAAGEEQKVQICFNPTSLGDKTATLRIYSNDPDENPLLIPLTGKSVGPIAKASVEKLEFGQVMEGKSLELHFDLMNEGDRELEVVKIGVYGSNANQFTITDRNVPVQLQPGESKEYSVVFAPNAIGKMKGHIRFYTLNTAEKYFPVPLTGEGIEDSTQCGVVLNEIHYNPATSQGVDNKFEFIELYNTCETKESLANFSFSKGLSHQFVDGDSIEAQGFLVLAADATSYPGAVQWSSGALVNTGEKIVLVNSLGVQVDSVDYGVAGQWPQLANGGGSSLELISSSLDNALGESWQASFNMGGTPGQANSTSAVNQPGIVALPDTLEMEDTTVGSSSAEKLIILNSGSETLELTKFATVGNDSAHFTVDIELPLSIEPRRFTMLDVVFSPTESGDRSVEIQISSNDPDSPLTTIPVLAKGIEEELSPLAGVLMITELHYNPATSQGSDTDFEFLELFNTSNQEVSLAGISFAAGITHTFSDGEIIPAEGYLVLAKTGATYPGSLQWQSGNLVNSGEEVKLVDIDGLTIDVVDYENGAPWPDSPNGNGSSLELKDLLADNSLAENWQASATIGGTPGAKNSTGATNLLMAAEPDSIDFGIVNMSDKKSLKFMAKNISRNVIQITEISLDAESGFAVSSEQLPINLNPNGQIKITVSTLPSAYAQHDAVVRIISADQGVAAQIPLSMYVNTPPIAPQLLQPSWGEETDHLTWSNGSDPDPEQTCSFFIEVSQTEKFETIHGQTEAIEDTTVNLSDVLTPLNLEPGTAYYVRVGATDNFGENSDYSNVGYFTVKQNITGIQDVDKPLPTSFALQQNYPNPFNPETKIHIDLPVQAQVQLKIYNMRGQLTRTLVDQTLPAGSHPIIWRGRNNAGQPAASGIYLAVMTSGKVIQIRKMTLLR